MKTYYQADGWIKFSEEDIYQDGCQPNSGGTYTGSDKWKADTLDGLLNEILSFTDGDREGMEIDACEEIGRVDISIMENADGCRATKQEIELWKEGDIQLWNCIYSFQIEQITANPVSLIEAKK